MSKSPRKQGSETPHIYRKNTLFRQMAEGKPLKNTCSAIDNPGRLGPAQEREPARQIEQAGE